jgi:hypothetical protein
VLACRRVAGLKHKYWISIFSQFCMILYPSLLNVPFWHGQSGINVCGGRYYSRVLRVISHLYLSVPKDVNIGLHTSEIIYIKTLPLLLPVSIAHRISSSGNTL